MNRLLQLLGELFCQHRRLSWPVCGHYQCFECGRVFKVSWSAGPDVSDRAQAVSEAQAQLLRAVDVP